MSVKIIAFVLIGAAVAGTVAVPTMWHAAPHTMRVPFEEYDEVARMIFAQPQPDSVQIMDCALRRTPAGADVVHCTSPPEPWETNEPLIYADGSRQRVAAYVRYLVVRD